MRIRIGKGSSGLLTIVGVVLLFVFAFPSLWTWIGGSSIRCPEGFRPDFSILNWVIQRGTDLNGDGWLCQQLISASPVENIETYEFVDNIK